MTLYILLSLWVFVLMIIGLRPDAESVIFFDPEHKPSSIAISNMKICSALASITLFILWVLTAFRSSNIGNDTATYISYFNIFSTSGVTSSRTFELGYQLLNVLIGKFTSDPHVFLIIMASIMYLGITIYIKKYAKNILVSLCLFFCCFFSIYTSIFRQGIAMIIVLFAYQRIKENKRWIGLVLILLAVSFHSTAIIALLLLVRSKWIVDKRIVIIATVVGFAISQTNILSTVITIVLPRYAHYFTSRYAASGWMAVTYDLIRSSIFFWLINRVCKTDNKEDHLRLVNFALLIIFSTFGFSMNLFTRAGEYFLLIGVTELPNVLYEKQLKYKRMWLFGICLVSIVWFIVVLFLRPDWNHLYPYEFWR